MIFLLSSVSMIVVLHLMLCALMAEPWPIRGLKGGQFRDSVISTHLSNFIYFTYYDNMLEYDSDYIRVSTGYPSQPMTPDFTVLFCNRT